MGRGVGIQVAHERFFSSYHRCSKDLSQVSCVKPKALVFGRELNRRCFDRWAEMGSRARAKSDGAPADPSESAFRSGFQTAVSCCRSMTVVVTVTEKA